MNRRNFLGFGGKVLAAGALVAHVGNEKIKAAQAAATGKPLQPIIMWQVTYDRGDAAVTREMSLRRGTYPPEKTNWNGRQYHRTWISPNGYSAFYAR